MIAFVKEDDVSAQDAIAVFGSSFNVMCITLVDPFTEEAELDKTMVLKDRRVYKCSKIANGSQNPAILLNIIY
jgi:hypothetical protein